MTEQETHGETGRKREMLAVLGAASVYEALGRRNALPPGIRPLWTPLTLVGPVFTVTTRAGDNLALHRAVAEAPAGVVIAAATEASVMVPIWGDLLSTIAQGIGILGLVTDGATRDSDRIRELGFPVFCKGTSVHGPTKEFPGVLGETIVLDGVAVAAGDWIVADGDGVVVVPADEVAQVIVAAQAITDREREIVRRAALGESTIDQLGLRGVVESEPR